MLSTPFAFHAPTTLDEALDLIGREPDETKLLAGGMSLMPVMNLGLAAPAVLVSLNHVKDLAYVREGGETLAIGAMTRHRVVASDPLIAGYCPLLAAAAGCIGDVQVRNRGTIGGSVSHADPSADYLAVLSALGARFRLRSGRGGERELTAAELLRGTMETAIQADEVLTEVIVPKLGPRSGCAYARLTRVEGSFAIVNAAVVVVADSVTLAVGGASPTPQVMKAPNGIARQGVEALQAWAEPAAREACAAADDDVESEYRTAMAGLYARRAVRQAITARDSANGSSASVKESKT
ncbi:MAG: FAD binding domain-containing protein [Candidatus Dormibacteria bacterium]